MLRGQGRYHDLTIIGLRGLFGYGAVHNPDDQIIKLIRCGVRPIIAVSDQCREVKRVLAAYNGSPASVMAMKRFAQLRLWPSAALKLACFEFNEEAATPLLIEAARYLRAHGYEPEAESLPGSAKKHLLTHALEWDADLVMMGSTYRGRIAKLMVGETTQEVLMHADMPLFLSQ